jgi:hypothetical protein
MRVFRGVDRATDRRPLNDFRRPRVQRDERHSVVATVAGTIASQRLRALVQENSHMNNIVKWSVGVSLLMLAGCAPQYHVVRMAQPNPLLRQRNFIVEPVHFEHVLVGAKTEDAYLAGKKSDAITSWQGDKVEMNNLFLQSLIGHATGLQVGPAQQQPGAGTFIIRPICTFIEVGTYNGFVNVDSRVDLTVQVLDANGTVLDEIAARATVPSSIYNPASGGRLRSASKQLGGNIAGYLHTRTAI